MKLTMKQILFYFIVSICLQNVPLTWSAPLEDSELLRQIANNYSAPLVVSVLHARIQNTAQMVEKMKSSIDNLNSNQRNMFTLKVKSLEALDKQLTGLRKTDYFNIDGTERVKHLIEQYILNNEIFPTELKYEEANIITPDYLLQLLNILPNDQLIDSTQLVMNCYLEDIEEKESNTKYNELQRLTASIIKRKLKTLVNFKYTEPVQHNNDDGELISITDNRVSEIEFVLRKLKSLLDLFYPQFANLASQNSKSSLLDPVTFEVKTSSGNTGVDNDFSQAFATELYSDMPLLRFYKRDSA